MSNDFKKSNFNYKTTDVMDLLKEFKTRCFLDDTMIEYKKRRYFMNKREKRKFKHDLAIKRQKNKKFRRLNNKLVK